MAQTDDEDPATNAARRRRSDAQGNIDAIVQAAGELLSVEPEASIEEIASAASVSRATVYRHFGTRGELVRAARQHARELADANEVDALRPAGELAGGPTPLDIVDVLNKVPPHLIGEQIVSEARRLVGVTTVALYLVDIDGSRLRRLAGGEEFPDQIETPLAVGPEIPREGLPGLRACVEDELPGSVLAPMFLRGRAIGVLLAVDAPEQPLLDLARHAAASLALAEGYSDVFDQTRRRKPTSPAAEIQQNLLPPRIARIAGGVLAGNVLPGYEIGGDWFDYVENRDGAWLGVADSKGHGTTAAALGAVSLGAFRAQRRVDAPLEAVAATIHETMREIAVKDACVNVIIGRWHAPAATFRWITCGHQSPMLVTVDHELVALDDDQEPPLGVGDADRTFSPRSRRLHPGERLLLISDGVLQRRTEDGETFGLEGVTRALAAVESEAAAPTVQALEQAIMAASADPLEDDATIVVFTPSSMRR